MLPPAIFALALVLAPYTGPQLPGSTRETTKFAVRVKGAAGQSVRLRAIGVPKGYIASFCTNVVCAPFSVTFALPTSGSTQLELQLIENQTGARRPTTVTVAANGGHGASIAFARGTH